MFAFVVLSGDWRRWREFRLLSGTVLFLVIAAPWPFAGGVFVIMGFLSGFILSMSPLPANLF